MFSGSRFCETDFIYFYILEFPDTKITDTFHFDPETLNNKTIIDLLETKFGSDFVQKFVQIHDQSLKEYLAQSSYSDVKWCFSVTDEDTVESFFLKIMYTDNIPEILQALTKAVTDMSKKVFILLLFLNKHNQVIVILFSKVSVFTK